MRRPSLQIETQTGSAHSLQQKFGGMTDTFVLLWGCGVWLKHDNLISLTGTFASRPFHSLLVHNLNLHSQRRAVERLVQAESQYANEFRAFKTGR